MSSHGKVVTPVPNISFSPLTTGLDSEPYHSIGDFSRATHMSVKMLRHYHQIGLLEPADVAEARE